MRNKIHLYWGALVFILSCLYLFPFFNLYQGGDEGYLLTGAQRILRGEAIYRDFYHFLAPGAFVLLALLFKIFGVYFWVVRLAALFTGALLAALTYLLAEKLLRNRYLALLPPFMVLVAGFPDWFLYSHHWLSSLLALMAVYLLVRGEEAVFYPAEENAARPGKARGLYFAAGLCAALSLAVMQSKGLLLLLALGAYLWFFSPRPKFNFKSYLLGALSGLALLFFYLLWLGTLKGFFYYTLLWPFTHYTRANSVPYFNLGKDFLWQSWNLLKQALLHPTPHNLLSSVFYLSEIFFLAVLGYLSILALAAAFIRGLKARRKKAEREGSLLCLYTSAAFAFFLSLGHRPDILHFIYGASLPLILFFYFMQKGIAASGLLRRDPRPRILSALGGLALVLMIMFLGINTLARGEDNLLKRFRQPHYAIEDPKGRQWTDIAGYAQDYNFLMSFMKGRLGPREPFIVMHYQPIIYFFLDAYNPTDTDYFYPEHNSEEQLNRILETIRQQRIRYILKDDFIEGILSGKDAAAYPYADLEVYKQEPVNRYLEGNYQPVLTLNHFTLYERKQP